jgi:hypothetical protein
LFVYSSNAQLLRRPLAAGYIGLGAYSANHADAFSFIANQACLARIQNITAGVYAERRFLLNELNHFTTVAVVPSRSGNFGLKTGYAGFTEYNETQIGIAYGRNLGSKLDIGVQFNYNGIRISNYGTASAISTEAGVVFHLSEKLHTGFHVSNPVGGKFGKDQNEKLASVYALGIGFEASKKFFISTAIEKEENQAVNVNAGFQYKLIKQLLVRAGISSATSSVWGGVGLSFNSFRIDVTTGYHPQLGITPGVLLLFNPVQKNEP